MLIHHELVFAPSCLRVPHEAHVTRRTRVLSCIGFAQSKDGVKWERLTGDERAGEHHRVQLVLSLEAARAELGSSWTRMCRQRMMDPCAALNEVKWWWLVTQSHEADECTCSL